MMLRLVIVIFLLAYCKGNIIYPLSFHATTSQIVKHNPNSNPEVFDATWKFNFSFILSYGSIGSADACTKSIGILARDVVAKKKYALTLLDSFGKPESGILSGNMKLIGSYSQCISTDAPEFNTKFCTLSFGETTALEKIGFGPTFSLVLGGCYPESCSESRISLLYEPLVSKTNLSTKISCVGTETTWNTKDTIASVVLLLLSSIVFVSTLYDFLLSSHDPKASTSAALGQRNSGDVHQLLISFSFLSNGKKLFSTQQPPSDISCLHGIRFFSTCWVVLFHSYLVLVSNIDNILSLGRYYMGNWTFQIVGNGTYAVEAFFFLSGLLAAYHGMRNVVKHEGKLHVLRTYFVRYMRLTTPFALLLFLSITLGLKFASGPKWAWLSQYQSEMCENYWYNSLLYFNNIYPTKLMHTCCGWSWYLANDFQFHLIAPIFVYLFYAAPSLGLVLAILLLLLSMTITGVVSFLTQQQPLAVEYGFIYKSALYPSEHNNSSSHPMFEPSNLYSDYIADVYAKPWCRIGPFLVGMCTGYIMNSKRRIQIPKVLVFAGWTACFGVILVILFGLYPTFSNPSTPASESLLSTNTAAFYQALSRPVWAIALSWLVVACVHGYGGPVNAILSWKIFIPLSRLAYCTYLIHPFVLWWMTYGTEKYFHFSIQLLIIMFCGTLVFSNLLAIFVTLLVEIPTMNLLKLWQSNWENSTGGKTNNIKKHN